MSKVADEVLKVREKLKAESLAKWKHNLEVAEAMDWDKWQKHSSYTRHELAYQAYKDPTYFGVPYIFDVTCPFCRACADDDCGCNGCPLYAGDEVDDVSCCIEWERVRDVLLSKCNNYTKEQLITAIKVMVEKIEGIDVSLPEREYLTQYRTDGSDIIPEDKL